MVLSGCPVSQISSMAGVSKAAVTGWVKTADEQGFDALRPKQRSGRPPKLSPEQCTAIDSAIQSAPENFGFKVWDGPSLSSYISSAFGVQISVRQWLKKRTEIENDDSLILVYQDEIHFQIQTAVTSAWYKKGSAPTVKSFPGRFKASYSGFIIPETEELFVARPEKFNYETTISSIRSFLEAHPAPKGKKYALVMDNAPWHKKTMRLIGDEHTMEYSDIFASVTFVKLPPYSPGLNPIEQVWRIMRRENTHNVFFQTLATLKDAVDRAFHAWATPNVQLRSLCSFS